jgi:hypothetical protein
MGVLIQQRKNYGTMHASFPQEGSRIHLFNGAGAMRSSVIAGVHG